MANASQITTAIKSNCVFIMELPTNTGVYTNPTPPPARTTGLTPLFYINRSVNGPTVLMIPDTNFIPEYVDEAQYLSFIKALQ